jgi:ubiquinone/menaquinone biosynthesis C-methylase UbiE
MTDSRLKKEAEFHNKAFTGNTRAAAGKFYAITARSKGFYADLIKQDCLDKNILEYGCGPGSQAFNLAANGGNLYGIDIADAAIDLAKKEAIERGVADKTNFQVMNAEELTFEDDFFDLICGSGILHHLDLELGLKEITRVLKKDGEAIFFEPLGHNLLINLYRRLTPQMRTEDEHPLLMNDLTSIGTYFKNVQIRYFHLTTLFTVPFRKLPGFGPILKRLEALDDLLFKIPLLKKQAWILVLHLSRPNKG